MKSRIDFPYDTPEIASCFVPESRLSAVYRMSEVHASSEPRMEIQNALENPIGTRRLVELARGKRRIAVLVDDNTRPTPVSQILPFVMEEIANAGIRVEQVSIVMALGSHRAMTESEMDRKLGSQIVREYRVLNSRFGDPKHLIYMGTSDDGVPILVDEEVAAADFKIGIGSIVPHGAVGWSGGAKIVYPGIAGHDTVMRFHFAHGLTEENMTGRDDCPIRLRMEGWADIIGLDFIVNAILTRDDQIYRITAGHYTQAHRKGVEFAKEVYRKRVKEKVDIVISASYAHDIDFWQAAKGIYGPETLLKNGGTLLLVTPCPEGIGPHPEFLQRVGRDDNRKILHDVLRGKAKVPSDPISLAPAAMLAKMRQRFHCCVVSPGVSREMLSPSGYERFEDAQSAIDTLLRRYPDGKVAAVLRSDLTFEE